MLQSDALYEGVLDELLRLWGKLRPVAGDLLAEENRGELADVGCLGRAEVLDESWDHLWILRQPLNLLLRLPPRVIVRHQELNQQQLQRLRHR